MDSFTFNVICSFAVFALVACLTGAWIAIVKTDVIETDEHESGGF